MLLNLQQIVTATSKYVRISPNKINLVLVKIRNKSYNEALELLKYIPQKAGHVTWQTLYSAISNATNRYNLKRENLFIVDAFANHGPMLKRMQPRAKGRAFKIQKRVSHVTIRVAEKIKN